MEQEKKNNNNKKKNINTPSHTHTHWQRNTRVACTGTALNTYRRRTREGGGGGAVSMQRGAASRWCCRCWPWMWGSLLFGGQPGLLSPIPRKDPSDANLDACTQHRHEHAHASPHRAGRNGPWCPMFCGNDGMHTMLATGKKKCVGR